MVPLTKGLGASSQGAAVSHSPLPASHDIVTRQPHLPLFGHGPACDDKLRSLKPSWNIMDVAWPRAWMTMKAD